MSTSAPPAGGAAPAVPTFRAEEVRREPEEAAPAKETVGHGAGVKRREYSAEEMRGALHAKLAKEFSGCRQFKNDTAILEKFNVKKSKFYQVWDQVKALAPEERAAWIDRYDVAEKALGSQDFEDRKIFDAAHSEGLAAFLVYAQGAGVGYDVLCVQALMIKLVGAFKLYDPRTQQLYVVSETYVRRWVKGRSELTMQTSSVISVARAAKATPDVCNAWFNRIASIITTVHARGFVSPFGDRGKWPAEWSDWSKIPASHIYCMDEEGADTNGHRAPVVGAAAQDDGMRRSFQLSNDDGKMPFHVSHLLTTCRDGTVWSFLCHSRPSSKAEKAPAYEPEPLLEISELEFGGLEGTDIGAGVTTNGSTTKGLFAGPWLKHFLAKLHAKGQGGCDGKPVVLLTDGHGSRFTLVALFVMMMNGILFMVEPSLTSVWGQANDAATNCAFKTCQGSTISLLGGVHKIVTRADYNRMFVQCLERFRKMLASDLRHGANVVTRSYEKVGLGAQLNPNCTMWQAAIAKFGNANSVLQIACQAAAGPSAPAGAPAAAPAPPQPPAAAAEVNQEAEAAADARIVAAWAAAGGSGAAPTAEEVAAAGRAPVGGPRAPAVSGLNATEAAEEAAGNALITALGAITEGSALNLKPKSSVQVDGGEGEGGGATPSTAASGAVAVFKQMDAMGPSVRIIPTGGGGGEDILISKEELATPTNEVVIRLRTLYVLADTQSFDKEIKKRKIKQDKEAARTATKAAEEQGVLRYKAMLEESRVALSAAAASNVAQGLEAVPAKALERYTQLVACPPSITVTIGDREFIVTVDAGAQKARALQSMFAETLAGSLSERAEGLATAAGGGGGARKKARRAVQSGRGGSADDFVAQIATQVSAEEQEARDQAERKRQREDESARKAEKAEEDRAAKAQKAAQADAKAAGAAADTLSLIEAGTTVFASLAIGKMEPLLKYLRSSAGLDPKQHKLPVRASGATVAEYKQVLEPAWRQLAAACLAKGRGADSAAVLAAAAAASPSEVTADGVKTLLAAARAAAAAPPAATAAPAAPAASAAGDADGGASSATPGAESDDESEADEDLMEGDGEEGAGEESDDDDDECASPPARRTRASCR